MRTMVRDSAIGYIGSVVMLGLGFATKILLARALPAAELGVLITGQAIVGLVLVLFQMSLPEAVVRFVGYYAVQGMPKAKGSLVNALQLSVLGSLLGACCLGLSAGLVADRFYHQPALTAVLMLLAAAMPFATVANVLAAAYRGLGQLWVKVVCVDLAGALWVVLMLVGLMSQGANTLLAIAGGYAIAALLSAFLTIGLFWRSSLWRIPPFRTPSAELLRYSLPLLAAGLLAGPIVNSGLPLLLGNLASTHAVAYYSMALSLQVLIYLPVSALELATLPVWSGQIEGGTLTSLRASYAFFTRWSYLAVSLTFALLFFNASAVLSIMYGPEYAVGASAVQAMAAVTLFGAAVGPNEGMLKAFASTRWIFFSRLIASGGALGVGFVLMPHWGLMGGVAAFVTSSGLINGLYAIYLFRKYGIHPLDRPYLKTLLASGVAFGLMAMVRPSLGNGWASIGRSAVLYPVLLGGLMLTMRAFTPEDGRAVGSAYGWFKSLVPGRRSGLAAPKED